ncbi:MAG: prepilin-type N-terminal cleavage/methylation domain-containing protein [Phycisphaerales bacterium]
MISPRRRRAFTLAELLVAMVITTTVMMGAVAAIGMGGRSFQAVATGVRSGSAMDGLARMASDIEQAIHVDERTATAIGFYVPDRTGDGTPDYLRYAWSGTIGDPVTLSFNGSDEAPIIRNVRDIQLEYVFAQIAGVEDWAVSAPSDEVVFEREYSGSPAQTFTVDRDVSVAAIVRPTAPGGASGFTVTRVTFPASTALPKANDALISLHRVDMATATPLPTALSEVVVRHEDFPASVQSIEIAFDSDAIFAAGDFVAIVVASDKDDPSLVVPLEASPRFLSDGWIATTTTGSNWTVNGARDMPITIYAVGAAR